MIFQAAKQKLGAFKISVLKYNAMLHQEPKLFRNHSNYFYTFFTFVLEPYHTLFFSHVLPPLDWTMDSHVIRVQLDQVSQVSCPFQSCRKS